jgi:hypothetical protein
MRMSRWLLLGGVALCIVGPTHAAPPGKRSSTPPKAGPAAVVTLPPSHYQVVSDPTAPRVAFALRREPTGMTLAIEVASRGGQADTTLAVGVAAAKTLILTEKEARVARETGLTRYTFAIPTAALVTQEADWARLRLGLAVAWGGGPWGGDSQRERFRHLGAGAPHRGLSPTPADWMPLDLTEHARQVNDRAHAIVLPYVQPMDGKATVVIEDTTGRRVRNLIAGTALRKGAHSLVWDGVDDGGQVVPPGTYRWRGIGHPGIRPQYLFAFCNDPGPNHSCLQTATAAGDWTVFGAPVTEGGVALMALDGQGNKVQQYAPVMGTGIERVALAAEGDFLYAAHDGVPWGKDRGPLLSITRFNLKTGALVEYPGGKRFITVQSWKARDPRGLDLTGLACLEGKLYLASRLTESLRVLDPKSGETLATLPLPKPGTLTTAGGKLYAVSGSQVLRVDPITGTSTAVVVDPTLIPLGVAVDPAGTIFVSDARTHTVRLYGATGAFVRTLGTPGGPYKGAYDPKRLVGPRGLALASNGWLWVTEERWAPKRLMAWEVATGQVARELFGPTAYGASGAGFDAADHTRWLGLGCQWKVDFPTKTATPVSILGSHFPAIHYRVHHQDGRTFLISFDGFTSISELRPDGAVKDLAFIGSTHRFCFALGWQPPQSFVDAFNAAYPTRKGKHGDKGPGVLWVDKSGDGEMQVDEFDFSTAVDNFAGAYWGHDQVDLTLRLPATVAGRRVLVTLAPAGFYAGGAPKYPPLNAASQAGVPIALATNEVETTLDRFGNLLVNSDPQMTSFAPDGTLRWTYPNRWSNVHGSHGAPLPEAGMMQGALFFLGVAPLDDKADVFVMNGNHGRFFVLTSDGLYLDEMFKDVRLGGAWDAYMIGGECFGGFFAKSAQDGQYYLQSGGIEYRLYRLEGLDKVVRAQGSVTVTPAQVTAAERALARQVAAATAPRHAALPRLVTPPAIDGADGDWTGPATVQWAKSGQFPVIARLGYDATHLYLHYTVTDPSPWINGGTDWTLLFKTGDSLDLQLGANPLANPVRSGPVVGDCRLLIAPFGGQPTVVLYRHRLPGGSNPLTFTSPWRSERVDAVTQVTSAQVAVVPETGRYRVEAAIPLAALGWTPQPGTTVKADLGVLFGDPEGKATMLRSYWANQATGLVNDVPGEIMLMPTLWGTLAVGEGR